MYHRTKTVFPKYWDSMNPLPNNDIWKKIERKLTSEEEKAAFLYTSKVNSARIFAKHLD